MAQFRFCYFTAKYEETVAFYRDGLEFPLLESWDRNPDDRGSLFGAASGIIEVVSKPSGPTTCWPREHRLSSTTCSVCSGQRTSSGRCG